jgi:hypothetical protein
MSKINQPLNDKLGFLAGGQQIATGNSGWIDMNLNRQIIVYIDAHVVGTSVDAKLTQATDNSGSGAKDITSLAITQLTAVGQVALVCYDSDLDIDNGFNHVRLEVTHGGVEENYYLIIVDEDNCKFPNFKIVGSENSVNTLDEIVIL